MKSKGRTPALLRIAVQVFFDFAALRSECCVTSVMNLKSIGLNLFKMFLGLFAGLVISELALHVFFPTPDQTKYYPWTPYLKQVFRPERETFPGIQGPTTFSANSLGIRGDEFSPNQTYRILAVGGSTTESLYLDDSKTWPHDLQVELNQGTGQNVWVGNVAKSGLDTRHHIYQMRYLLPQYSNPRIDAVIILVGINDLWHFTVPAHIEQFSEDFELSRTFALRPAPNIDELFYKKTALWVLLRRVKENLFRPPVPAGSFVEDVEGKVYPQLRLRRRHATAYVNDLPDMTQALQDYTRNLNTLIDLAQAHSARIILMTQPSMYKDVMPPDQDALIWGGALENQGKSTVDPNMPDRYYSTGALALGMKRYNDTLLQVCQSRNIECIDLAIALPKDTTIFYSDVHYNENGAKQVANVVAQYLLSHPPFKK